MFQENSQTVNVVAANAVHVKGFHDIVTGWADTVF